ncbi:MAG: hypothetical protein KAT26_07570, partial [Marinosulfonomonas sp.]|nr:hypothetical protein [Marinosulfonomonas sp.]
MNYTEEFPIPSRLIPARLAELLEPLGKDPKQRIEVAARFDQDTYGPCREYLQMLIAIIPKGKEDSISVLREASDGVVSYSVPVDDHKGVCADYNPSVSGFDYMVASRGDGSFYTFVLAEKVWMMLGLTPRCVGGERQKIIFD